MHRQELPQRYVFLSEQKLKDTACLLPGAEKVVKTNLNLKKTHHGHGHGHEHAWQELAAKVVKTNLNLKNIHHEHGHGHEHACQELAAKLERHNMNTDTERACQELQRLSRRPLKTNSEHAPPTHDGCVSHSWSSKSSMSPGSHLHQT